jgi:hypothetical protein
MNTFNEMKSSTSFDEGIQLQCHRMNHCRADVYISFQVNVKYENLVEQTVVYVEDCLLISLSIVVLMSCSKVNQEDNFVFQLAAFILA